MKPLSSRITYVSLDCRAKHEPHLCNVSGSDHDDVTAGLLRWPQSLCQPAGGSERGVQCVRRAEEIAMNRNGAAMECDVRPACPRLPFIGHQI